jgi:hypothetical protein
MLGLLRAWGAAALVWIVGTALMAALTPSLTPGEALSPGQQVFRIHLPWLVISTVLVPVAVVTYWRPPSTGRLLLAALPVPALAIALGVVAGLSGATSALATLLYVAEGLAGAALGLLMTWLVRRGGKPVHYPY